MGPDVISAGPWHDQLKTLLCSGESVVSWFESDLDRRLHLCSELMVLTDRRILSLGIHGATGRGGPGEASDPIREPDRPAHREHPLRTDLQLTYHDHAGIGVLTLADGMSLLVALYARQSGAGAWAGRRVRTAPSWRAGEHRTPG